MNIVLEQKKRKLLEKYGHPRSRNEYSDAQARYDQDAPFVWGVVVDNKDPECLGRVRVSMDLVSPGCVSPWYQLSGRWTGNGRGFWELPAIGTQVVVAFPYGNYSRGVVLGCVYDEKHLPPKTSTENPAKSILWQTKKHRIEIIDEDGKESISIETAGGKMRAVISSDGGIRLENELGDIKIKCRKLILKAGDSIELNGRKRVSISSDDGMSIKAKKTIGLGCDKEVTLKGKNIKLSGTNGVTTEGKQIATQDDKVMGFDIHIMVVPAGVSTANVPLPHPFIGKINDKVSDDVKIKGKGVAVKGSKAKHDDSMHLQLPGTIKFQNNPKKEGEVTGETGSKVKVDGKEVAVIGSQVTTCNDMGMQNNSTVIAPGASIPMPMILNPQNSGEFEREQKEKEKREPKFTSVKWGSQSVKEGEEAELTAGVQDIADGNMVTLQVFREGKGPEDGFPLATFPLTLKNGSVSAKWSYSANKSELPPEQNPKFIFSAHSAWCNFEKSGNTLEVKLVRPEIRKAEWQDKDGNSTEKGLVGEPLKLVAETKDVEGSVTFRVYDDKGRQVFEKSAKIKEDKAETEWTYQWNGEKLDHKPKFTFEVTGQRCKMVESVACEIGMEYNLTIYNSNFKLIGAQKVRIFSENGESYEKQSDDNGKIKINDLIPNKYWLRLLTGQEEVKESFDEQDENRDVVTVDGIDLENEYLLPENKNVFIEVNYGGIVSV